MATADTGPDSAMCQQQPSSIRATRASSITGFAALARSLGLDPEQVADSVGLPREALQNPDLMVPTDRLSAAIEKAAALSGLSDFGLRLATRRKLSNWGALALVVREQPTLGEAIDAITRYIVLQSRGVRLTRLVAGDLVEIHVDTVEGGGPGGRQAIEIGVAALHRNLREVIGGSWRPAYAAFRHPRPASLATYRLVFDSPVLFDQIFDGLIIHRRDLALPVPGADPSMARPVREFADSLLRQIGETLTAEVTRLAMVLLPTGRLRRELVARELGLSVRTLQRRLAEEGSTFADVVDAARRRLAQRYLDETSRPLVDIADLLGFQSPSAFARWYRERHGESPSDRRKALGGP